MKTKLLLLLFIIVSTFKVFASNSLEVSYKNENISINYYLCYEEELLLPEIADIEKYKKIENDFYNFLYFTDSLIKISYKINSYIKFSSEHDLSELTIGENTYLFVSDKKAFEIQSSIENYIITEDYKNPDFIIPFICKNFKIKIPKKKINNRNLYTLKINDIPKIDFLETNDTDIIFFYPSGEVYYSPFFEIEERFCIGFYYSLQDAKKMQKILKRKYNLDSNLKRMPVDFNLINKAYFKIKN